MFRQLGYIYYLSSILSIVVRIYQENSAFGNDLCWYEHLQTRETKLSFKYIMYLGQHFGLYPSSGLVYILNYFETIVKSIPHIHPSNADAQSVLQVTLPNLPVALSAKFLLQKCGLMISFPICGGGSQPAASDRESQHSAQVAHPDLPAQALAVDGNWKR